MKPRIFVSAVTGEFGQVRQLVANALLRLGYEPVWQEVFGTEAGDLRGMLRGKIDGCEGLVQLVGQAYGFEPPEPDPEFGRVSYTQYEFLYARRRGGIRTWLIFPDASCTRDRPVEQLDLPTEPGHPDPFGRQAERRALQVAYCDSLSAAGHLRHRAATDDQLLLRIEQLKDELAGLRRGFRRWQTGVAAGIGLVLLVALVGVWWTIFGQPQQLGEAVSSSLEARFAEYDPDLVRIQLERAIGRTHEGELAAADKLTDWGIREAARRAANEANDQRLSRVAGFLASLQPAEAGAKVSAEQAELTRILQEQGVDEALAYVTSRQKDLLDRAGGQQSEARRDLHATLEPLLDAIELRRARGQLLEALQLADELLLKDYNWAAVHEHRFWILHDLADRARRYETLAAALQRAEAALEAAAQVKRLAADRIEGDELVATGRLLMGNLHLSAGETGMAIEQLRAARVSAEAVYAGKPAGETAARNRIQALILLGDAVQRGGALAEAVSLYREALEFSDKLQGQAGGNEEHRRERMVVLEKLGEALLAGGDLEQALECLEQGHAICKELAAGAGSPAARRDLSISHFRLAGGLLQAGQLPRAMTHSRQAVKLAQQLAEELPDDIPAQREMALARDRLGEMLVRTGSIDKATDEFQRALEVRERLVTLDPASSELRRDVSMSLNRLGELLLRHGDGKAALEIFQRLKAANQELANENPQDNRAQQDLSVACFCLGHALILADRPGEAASEFREMLRIATRLASEDPGNLQLQRATAIANVELSVALLKSGLKAEAAPHLEAGAEISRAIAAASPGDRMVRRDVGLALNRLGDFRMSVGLAASAQPLFEEGLAISEELLKSSSSDALALQDVVVSRRRLGRCAVARRGCEAALPHFQRALAVARRGRQLPGAEAVFETLIGEITGELDELELIRKGIDPAEDIRGWTVDRQRKVLYQRVCALGAAGDFAGAGQWLDHWQTLEPDAEGLYEMACATGVLLQQLETAAGWSSADVEMHRSRWRETAIKLLEAAVLAGYDDRYRIAREADLSSLKDMPQFRRIVEADQPASGNSPPSD